MQSIRQQALATLALSAILVVGAQAAASAQMKVSKPSTEATMVYSSDVKANSLLGVGYKLGNGIGFAGADLIVNPIANLSLDLQVATVPGGVGFAPALQYHLDPTGGPYAGVGYQRAQVSANGTSAAVNGVFGNVGWQWMPLTNLGVQFGVGYQRLIGADDGLNFEFGTRYFFL
jgi:hypothetical protein